MKPDDSCGAVMLIGFGGPNGPAEIRPFLDRVLKGRPVTRERYEEVVHHYEALGGRSPYNELTLRQAAALREALRREGGEVPVTVGMRNARPYLEDALAELKACGVRRAFGFVLSAFRCEASWERYQNDVEAARERVGEGAPTVDYPPPWHRHPLFIEATVDRVKDAIARLDPKDRETADLIFTAHSIPVAMAAQSPYVQQFTEAATKVANAAGRATFMIAYQSRSGSPREAWLEPDINQVLRGQAGRAAIIAPIGFLCDHVEVLYDLDIEAAAIARAAGIAMARAATVGDHPRFIEMMAEIALPYLAGTVASE